MSEPRKPDLPPDPTGLDEPHDVLAAEEFAVPARPAGAVPHDPSGIKAPHDVLAAEDFAMPSGGVDHSGGGLDPRSFIPGLVLAVAIWALIALLRR